MTLALVVVAVLLASRPSHPHITAREHKHMHVLVWGEPVWMRMNGTVTVNTTLGSCLFSKDKTLVATADVVLFTWNRCVVSTELLMI